VETEVLYVDASALVKRYVAESNSAAAVRHLLSDPAWVTGRHTYVEVRRTLALRLDPADRGAAVDAFESDWKRTTIVSLDESTCRLAAALAETTRVRTLDALHLAAASRTARSAFLTFDLRLAAAARALGFEVVGA
jgi:hypothetical protein